MDGLTYLPPADITLSVMADQQKTLRTAIVCTGVGLHTGKSVSVRLRPASADHGIVFHRTDLGVTLPARFDHVIDTRLCTVIGRPDGARVATVEHLMAALAGLGIDNLRIDLDGPELPVFDGSAEPWVFLLDCAGIETLPAPRRSIQVLRTVRVEDGDAFAELRPGQDRLDLAVSIDFEAAAIGRQALTVSLQPWAFRQDLARARTFAQRHEIEGLQRAGLARGGSLGNAVVVDGARIVNPDGLRMTDEFVRHKMLDAVGDLALAGAPLVGRFVGHKSGHALNNQALRALFADPANWRAIAPAEAKLAA